MSKVIKISLIITLIVLVLTVCAVAWFVNTLNVDVGIKGTIHKSYFESGDGTSAEQFIDGQHDTDLGCAFEIKYPVQLYYFAWLQYLGYFNQPIENSTEINQVYFYLSDDLDMTGWVLPPIGNTNYQFVGNFNGNGHTISNLTVQNVDTTSNNLSLSDSPIETLRNSEIIGFFGVVGSLAQNGTVNAAIDNNTSFSVAPNYIYNSQINEISNFDISNITVITETTNSLIGIVAGYVNGTIEDVTVSNSGTVINNALNPLSAYTNNISDYLLIGYATEDYKDLDNVVFNTSSTEPSVDSQFNYMSQGQAAGWGGSIDMKDIFQRITSVRTHVSNATYYNEEIRRYNINGELTETIHPNSRQTDTDYRVFAAENSESGRYVFSYINNSASYHYLAALYKNVKTVKPTNEQESAFYISHNGTYLNINNTHTAVVSNGENAKWILDENGYIRSADEYCKYLNYIGGNLVLDDFGVTTWTKTNTNDLHCSNGYLQYYDNKWTVLNDSTDSYYTIAYGNNYLNATSTSALGTGNGISNTPTHWYFEDPGSGNNGYIYTIINGTAYYLRNSSSNNGTLRLTNSYYYATTWYWTNGNSTRLRAGNNSGRYVHYANGWTGSNTSSDLTITEILPYTHTHLTFEETTATKYIIELKEEPDLFSYIPLSASQTSPYNVNQQNTGYIIGGSHETTSDRKSDIRISQYAKTNISSGLTSTNTGGQVRDSSVRTVDGSGIHVINTSNFQKYSLAVAQFNSILENTTAVYGLHFMNAEISIDNLIIAPEVLLEGVIYTNYQMPEDSIDFNVHQKGYINFFAGTYFTNNNSFFSLHIITRDANKNIISIKEIKQIWKSSDASKDYIYLLQNGNTTEWSAEKTNDYSLVFNTTWITHPGTINQLGTTNLYYFEVPVNAGEYALGSVEGRIGAYLLYLDIAANAQLVDRTTIIENFTEITKTYDYPHGITFENIDKVATAELSTTNRTSTIIVVDNSNVTISSGLVNYISNELTVNNVYTRTSIPAEPDAIVIKKTKKVTYNDYNIALNRYTVTIVEFEQIDNGAKTIKINAWNTDSTYNIEGATQIATMENSFVPNLRANTNNVEINHGIRKILEYINRDGEVCYLININNETTAQALRIEANDLETALIIVS